MLDKQVLLYLPVLHAGYENFLDRHSDAQEILVIGTSFRDVYRSLKKDIRALEPEHVVGYLRQRYSRQSIVVVELETLHQSINATELVVSDESIMREIVSSVVLPSGTVLVYDSTFLRWERDNSQSARKVQPSCVATRSEMSQRLIGLAEDAANQSSDWWRHVGAVIARNGEAVVVAYNRHMPTEYTPYFNGDPRASFNRGVRIDLSTALHAEQGVIAEAARLGIPLNHADIYVTTFPCPGCARLIAASGITTCYYADEYAVLDGAEVLETAGVKLIRVDIENPSSA